LENRSTDFPFVISHFSFAIAGIHHLGMEVCHRFVAEYR